MNLVILQGNIGADPEVKYTQGGTAIMKLRMATSRNVKKGDQWQEETTWHTVTVFGKRAEGLAKHVVKGTKLLVRGRINNSSWEDNDGNKKWFSEVVADEVEFAGGKRADGGSGGSGGGERRGGASGGGGGSGGGGARQQGDLPNTGGGAPPDDWNPDDEDIPF